MRNWLKYLFLFWVLVFSTGSAMAQYVTIGTSTANNLYTTRLFTTYFEDSKAEMNFLSTELNGASTPLVLGDTIYSIGWYVIATNSGKQVMYNANIKFTEVTTSVVVWSGNLAPNDGWNDILLNQPYIWQGGNLTVEYCFDNCEFTNNFRVRRSNGAPSFDYDYFDDDNGCSITPIITGSHRPNTRFGKSVPGAIYSQDTICLGTSVALSSSSSSSFTLNTSISGFTYKGLNNGSYYFLSTSNKTWLEADLNCRQNRGHLAHIANVTENNYVKNNVINFTSWIGLYQDCNNASYSEPAGGWVWSNDNPLIYTNWNNNEPNDYYGYNSENYVEMRPDGKWNDHRKTRIIPYVLEIEETYLWNTGATTSTITESPTTTTTYWVDHSLGLQTTREYFNVVIGAEGCTDPSACNYDANAICDDGSCVLNIFVTAGSNQTICNGGISANLAANGSSIGTYSWSPASAFVNPNLQNPSFNSAINTTTVYTVTFTDAASGCIANDDVTITVNPIPLVTLTALPNLGCVGDDIVLTASTSIPVNKYRFQYNISSNWNNLTIPLFGVNNPEIYNNITQSTQFRVKVKEASGCNVSNWSTPITVPIVTFNTLPILHN